MSSRRALPEFWEILAGTFLDSPGRSGGTLFSNAPAESSYVRTYRLFSRTVSVATILVGVLVLVGWWLHLPSLTRILPGLATMKPETAICFLLSGVCLLMIQLPAGESGNPRLRRINLARVLSGAVALLGLLTVTEYLFDRSLGIDEAFFRGALQATGLLHPGRMSGATALGFLVLGASLLLITTRWSYAAQAFALLTSLNGFVACVGYLLGVRSLYAVAAYSSMALHTTLLFVLLGLATLAARPRTGLMATITSEHVGGLMARRVLPMAILLPILLGWLRWRGQLAGLYDAEFGIALRTLCEVMAFAALLWISARWLNQVDEGRWSAEQRNYQLAAIVESSHDAILSKDLSGNIVTWNRGAEHLYGYQAEEIIGKPIATIVPPELQDEATRFLPEIAKGQLVTREDTIRRRKDGTLVHVSLIISPVRDFEGRIIGASTIAHDITERKLAESALHASRARLSGIIDSAMDGIITIDHNQRIMLFNPAAERMFGYSAQEMAGQPLERLLPERFREAHARHVRAFAQTGTTARRMGMLGRLSGMRADGQEFPIEASISATSIDDEHYLTVILRDVSERERTEEELRKSEERFSKAFRSSPLAITISTLAEGRYVDVNDAYLRMMGYEREQVIGRTIGELNIWAIPEARASMLEQLTKAEQPVTQVETRFITATGDLRTVLISAELVQLGGTVCVLAITNDVTDARHLEEQFRQAQKMEAVGRLAGGVAHDFNNILSVILGYAELSQELLEPGTPVHRNNDQVRKAAQRAAALTRQLLAFSRQQVLQPRILNLNAVVHNIIKMLHRFIGEDITLSFIPSSPLGNVKADSGQIEQVLMNLVVNARDAMPNGGKITIQTANAELDATYVQQHSGMQPGAYVQLSVTDTGCGMDKKTISRIFEPFFTTKPVGEGTGLGLSMVYGVVKQSGGNIWVYSEPGKGTTFKIYLPQIEEPAESAARPLIHTSHKAGSETILLVEDDEALRRLTAKLLVGEGYKVLEANDGHAAMEIARNYAGQIDLLLTDVIMPGMGGNELATSLRESQPKLSILYMSGYSGNLIANYGVLESNAALLQKPFTKRALLIEVREALDRGNTVS